MDRNIFKLNDIQFKYSPSAKFSLKLDAFSIEKNTQIFIEGPSGCGKTTFLNLLTGLLSPNHGSIQVLGTDITLLNQSNCDRFRADHFGIIFQLFNLIPYLSVLENIILPCSFSSLRKQKAMTLHGGLNQAAKYLCNELEIEDYLISKPVHQLSIGQQQRVAIARAFIGQPEIIIADEPTSALDSNRKDQFMSLLLNECDKYQTTLIFVSHDYSLQSKFNSIFELNQNGFVEKTL